MNLDTIDAGYIDKLSVFQLVTRLEDWAVTNVIGGRSQVYPEREILVAALRKAAIREASVGTVYVARDFTNGCPEFRFKCPESLTGVVKSEHICQLCGELMPERQYVLIPSNLIPREAKQAKQVEIK